MESSIRSRVTIDESNITSLPNNKTRFAGSTFFARRTVAKNAYRSPQHYSNDAYVGVSHCRLAHLP